MLTTMSKSVLLSLLSVWASTSFVDAAPSQRENNIDTAPDGISKIIGGENANVGDYPYFVQGPGCAGALISPDTVLWAAHCGDLFLNKQLSIGAFSNRQVVAGAQSRFCDVLIADPKFATGCPQGLKTFINWDFSLCKLDAPIKNLSNPQNISIALNFEDSVPAEDELLDVMGFGNTNPFSFVEPAILQKVQVPYVSNEVCNEPDRYAGLVTEQMLCAGFVDKGEKDACQGDSGGPIIKRTTTPEGNIVDLHLGVVSWGFGCADPLYPGVYSRTSKRTDWIIDTTCGDEIESVADFCGNEPKPFNGQGFEDPPTPTCNGQEFVATVGTDNFGTDISWTLRNSANQELKFRKYELDNASYEHPPICLPYNDCYTFRIDDSFGDGLCVGGECGFYKGELDGVEVFAELNPVSFSTTDTKSFCTSAGPVDPVDPVDPICVDEDSRCAKIKNPKICSKIIEGQLVSDVCKATCATVGLGPCA